LPDREVEQCIDDRLRGFVNYDHAVDVVSAFEMLYTVSDTKLPATVRHFERFPRISVDEQVSTPDFALVFNDGGGLAGEIARIALHDNSVESLCRQIYRYDSLTRLPIGTGTVEVSFCDVLLLMPMDITTPAIRRILHERMAAPGHWYKPSVPPCVVQFGFDGAKWVFQRYADPANGTLREENRADGISKWFPNTSINVRPERFAEIKAARAFMNDSVDSLYLATHLWSKSFATMASEHDTDLPLLLETTVDELGSDLRTKYGHISNDDVRRALELLATAKLAEGTAEGTWYVAWDRLYGVGERELERVLASRACRPPATTRLRRLRREVAARPRRQAGIGQLDLFGQRP
jgi:hypothetical protein